MRLLKALPGFVDDPYDDGEERDRVDEASNNLETQVAKGPPGIGRASSKAEGRTRDRPPASCTTTLPMG